MPSATRLGVIGRRRRDQDECSGSGGDPQDDPALMVNGGDPQLDKAIELMLTEIEQNPYVPPKRPPYPDRSGMGVLEKDR